MVPISALAVKVSSDRRLSSARELGSVPVIMPLDISMALRSEKYLISLGTDPLSPFFARITGFAMSEGGREDALMHFIHVATYVCYVS